MNTKSELLEYLMNEMPNDFEVIFDEDDLGVAWVRNYKTGVRFQVTVEKTA